MLTFLTFFCQRETICDIFAPENKTKPYGTDLQRLSQVYGGNN